MENFLTLPGAKAAENLSTSQFLCMQLISGGSSGFEVGESTLTTQRIIGILQNNPSSSGQGAEVAYYGVCKAQYGGTVALNDLLGPATDGQLVTVGDSSGGTTGMYRFAVALESGAADEVHYVLFLGPVGRVNSTA